MASRNQNDEYPIIIKTVSIPSISTSWVANGTANVTISNVAPSGVGTATISRWLAIQVDDILYYIPAWT